MPPLLALPASPSPLRHVRLPRLLPALRLVVLVAPALPDFEEVDEAEADAEEDEDEAAGPRLPESSAIRRTLSMAYSRLVLRSSFGSGVEPWSSAAGRLEEEAAVEEEAEAEAEAEADADADADADAEAEAEAEAERCYNCSVSDAPPS